MSEPYRIMKFYVDEDDRIKKPEDMNLDGCQALAVAVAKQAAADWRHAVEREQKMEKPRMLFARRECEAFFQSEWFHTITGADGQYVLRKLKREYRL